MSKRVNPHIRLITVGLLLVIWSSTTAAETIHVDPNAPGRIIDSNSPAVHDGNSWLSAYNYLQDALADAVSGDQIRVANGTYRPDPARLFDPRGATFQLINGVTIRGGYAGFGAPDPNQRDVQNNVTTLSGDLLGNDPSRADNCYHVVSGSGTNTTAVIDGFTITGGNATNTSGGGMFNNPGSPTVANCLFRGNSATFYGGGMYNRNFNSELIDCTFTGNSADKYGGGLYNQTSSPKITNCTFTQNSSLKRGGGICNYSNSNPELTNCRFTGNSAVERGGGVYNYNSTPDIVNCIFTDNSSANDGGGIYNHNNSDPDITNCTFSGNYADIGGAMYNDYSDPLVTNCTFAGNRAISNGGGMYNYNNSYPDITNCTFSTNWTVGLGSLGGGMYSNGGIQTVTNCIFWANEDSSDLVGPAQIQGGSPQVTYSCIQDDDPNDGDIPFDDANIDDDPMFVRDPNAGGDGWGDDPCTPGVDEAANDDFGDLHLLPGSPCIDAGDNTMVPADTHDLDDDLDTSELTPLDLDYDPRFIDDPTTPDTGQPAPPDDPNIVDMGAYEYKYVPGGPKYCGGTGTAEDPYLICDANQMQEIGANPDDWDKHFELIADIDLARFTGTEFNIIGTKPGLNGTFNGTFDGNGHTISNLTYTTSGKNFIGLFTILSSGGEIKDLGLINVNVDAGTGENYYVGGLVGANDGTVSNCYTTGSVTGSAYGAYVGGLMGANGGIGVVSNCHATSSVEGYAIVGGLVGLNFGTISNCYATGDVLGEEEWGTGGLVGLNDTNGLDHIGTVSNCYATGDVLGNDGVGGLVGANESMISNCYATGPVSGTGDVGGLVGADIDGSYTSSFWDSDVNSGLTGVGNKTDPAEVMGRTTAQMQTETTFTDAGWDFTTPIWKICDGAAYPRLWWEARALDGDVNNDCMVNLVDLAIVSYQWQGVPGDPSADIAPPGGDGAVNSDDLLVVAGNWLAGTQTPPPIPTDLTVDLTLDETWMYQNVGSLTNAKLTATVSITDDPLDNSSYTYDWEFILPGDVSLPPTITDGGGPADPNCKFAAPSCDEPDGLSDSGQALTVRVTVTGDDYANSGTAEAQFGIALLADVNNNGTVNLIDRILIDEFWRTGSAGSFTLRDCNVNSDAAGTVNVVDKIIATEVWRGNLSQSSVSSPCPLR